MLAPTPSPLTPADDLARRMLPTVRRIAGWLIRRLPAHVRTEDLVSAGHQGLADAIARFDPACSEQFASFAERRIRGAMLDELRARDPLSRDQRAHAKRVTAATRALTARLGRRPSADEIAAELDIPLEQYWEQSVVVATRIQSLDNEVGALLPDRDAEGAEDRLCRAERARAMRDAVRALPPRLRRIIELHHSDGLTLKEIGELLGVTESRVCQLRSEALRHLRDQCRNHLDAEPSRAERRPPASTPLRLAA